MSLPRWGGLAGVLAGVMYALTGVVDRQGPLYPRFFSSPSDYLVQYTFLMALAGTLVAAARDRIRSRVGIGGVRAPIWPLCTGSTAHARELNPRQQARIFLQSHILCRFRGCTKITPLKPDSMCEASASSTALIFSGLNRNGPMWVAREILSAMARRYSYS